ncbi:aromatic acid/H+ symport family MFS transporter [Corynebacterium breve]|uniref:Aromatic acid/H+ symport family MFS transporter n=1 Tax=Corynebacterium breve TaxID=3049799 RepID=A0ABY8VJK8_9CORY|nr:aromatic acid/H+ symport family MFS transporter [Corynebacterium breve]WIM68965.1 aromatic acid/H+ symport family MFS transporter [Corynebacterium breve]
MSVKAPLSPPLSQSVDGWKSSKHKASVYGVVVVMFLTMIFDGYDIVVYGAILPTLLNDPSHLGHLSPAVAGTLGSYTMIGILFGALGAGAIGDRIGRRKMMLVALAWFSIGMALGAMATSIAFFGATRFFTGLALGVITAGGGAVIAEFAPAHRKNMFNAIGYTGIPFGGVIASFFALWLEDSIGWRGLFFIGASPILFLLPLAWFLLPESPRWLTAMGRKEQARQICHKFDFPEEQFTKDEIIRLDADGAVVKKQKIGLAAIFSRPFLMGTLMIGIMSFMAIMATYGLNTWLPQIMQINGMSSDGSLYSLVALNSGAALGALAAAKIADMIGAKPVIIVTFTIAAICMFAMPYLTFAPLMYAAIAATGLGVTGTQILVYGMTSNYYPTRARQAGMSWAAGFGRLGGIAGPSLGGIIIAMGLGASDAFIVFAVATVVGAIATMAVPPRENK